MLPKVFAHQKHSKVQSQQSNNDDDGGGWREEEMTFSIWGSF
jgi:hypothetical protein